MTSDVIWATDVLKISGGFKIAFIRWRGRCAQLLATVYRNGRSQQVTLASLPGFYISESTMRYVAEESPDIKVDSNAVTRALAQGPPTVLKNKVPQEHLDMALVENYLRKWAAEADRQNLVDCATCLYKTANILTDWRADFYRKNSSARSKK
ncbi:MAG: hypothetical protein QXI12_09815 [Candidatus Methanomethyliaceae archaeon]